MNFSEFKKLLGADPLNTDQEMLAARRSGPEFEQAAREAEAFEHKLAGALRIGVDAEALLDDLLEIPASGGRRRNWVALAASFLAVVGITAIIVYRTGGPATVEEYVEYHYRHDGGKVLARVSNDFNKAEVNQIMARFGFTADQELVGKIDFIKLCPTLNGEGAHMIVSSAKGPVTVIFMPATEVEVPRLVRFDGMEAQVIALESGSAAIIAEQGQAPPSVESLLKTAIARNSIDA